MSTTAVVIVLLVAVVLPVAVIGIVFGLWFARRTAESTSALAVQLGGEPAICGPASGTYRGTTGEYSKVSGAGYLALTPQRLLFRKLTGGAVEVPLCDITAVHAARWVASPCAHRQQHLVIETARGDVAFRVRDLSPWIEALTRATRGRAAA